MRPNKLTDLVQSNTRKYERPFRQLEQECAAASTVRLDLEMKIHDQLKAFAGIQLAEQAPVEGEVARQLELRIAEEGSMRDQLGRVEADISNRLAALQAQSEQLDACQKVANGILAADTEYMRRLQAYKVDNAGLESRQSTLTEVLEECARKLPAFAADTHYSYLKAAGYGTDQYAPTPMSRMLDGWIAKLCSFKQNAANEQMLLAMRAEAFKRAGEGLSQLKAEGAWLEDRARTAATTAGVTALVREIDANRAAIDAGKKRANDIHATLAEYAECRDSRYLRARDLLAEQLKGQNPDALLARARQTATGDDDAIALEIQSLQEKLDAHNAQLASLHEQRQAAEDEYTRAKVIERELRRDQFASSRYRYKSELDMDSLLVGYMAGSMNTAAVAQSVRSYQEVIEDVPVYRSSGSGFSSRPSSSGGGSGRYSSSDDDTSRSVFSTSSSFGGGDSFSSSSSDSYSSTDSF